MAGTDPRADAAALRQELDELRRSVDALRAGMAPRVQARLWSVQETIYLGQSATVLAQIVDGAGRPLADQPVTVLTSWGELGTRGAAPAGDVLVARSGEAGMIELLLRPRFEAPLSDAQLFALDRAAASLPAAAPSPAAAEDQLGALVARYRGAVGADLREAIDAAARERAASLQQAANRGQALAEWRRITVSLLCFAHDEGDEPGPRGLALAAHTLTVVDWLPTFVAAFEYALAKDGQLGDALKRVPRPGGDAGALLADVFATARAFVGAEVGQLGQALRGRAAEGELRTFLQSNAAAIPEASRLDAAADLADGSRTIGETGVATFTALEKARGSTARAVTNVAGSLGGRLTSLEGRAITADQLDTVRTDLTRAQTELTQRLGQLGELHTQLTQRLGQLGDLQSQLTQRVGQLGDRQAELGTQGATLRRDLDALGATSTALRTELGGLNSSLAKLDARVTRQITDVGNRIDVINTKIRPR